MLGNDGGEIAALKLPKGKNRAELPANSFVLESYGDELYLPYEEHLRFAMFLILAGLKHVSWRELEHRNLFGAPDALLLPRRQVGYGLF